MYDLRLRISSNMEPAAHLRRRTDLVHAKPKPSGSCAMGRYGQHYVWRRCLHDTHINRFSRVRCYAVGQHAASAMPLYVPQRRFRDDTR